MNWSGTGQYKEDGHGSAAPFTGDASNRARRRTCQRPLKLHRRRLDRSILSCRETLRRYTSCDDDAVTGLSSPGAAALSDGQSVHLRRTPPHVLLTLRFDESANRCIVLLGLRICIHPTANDWGPIDKRMSICTPIKRERDIDK
jgi:hypothetical protein